MNTFKNFLDEKQKIYCSVCGKEIKKIIKVNIRATNPLHKYHNSGRPIVYTYNLKLCSKHFNKLSNQLNKFLQNE